MFSHLDDPNPPLPGPDRAVHVAAEGYRRRRRRHRVAAGLGMVAVLAAAALLVANRGTDEEQVLLIDAPTTTLASPEPGDAAVWTIDPADPPAAGRSRFTALVERLGCSGGVTGRVLPPAIERTASVVVVTFRVEADPDGGTCPGNDRVPTEVDLGEPLGERDLLDGTCRFGAEARSTSHCTDLGIRLDGKGSAAPTLAEADARQAIVTVRTFLERLRANDLPGAADLWTGYSDDYADSDDASEKAIVLAQIRADRPELVTDPDPTFLAISAASFRAVPVVTVVVADPAGGRTAVTFLLDGSGSSITRVPSATTPRPGNGEEVAPGEELSLPASPVEGGVRVFAGELELVSTFDHNELVVRFTLPEDLASGVVVTVSEASPELPDSYAVWYRVRGGG